MIKVQYPPPYSSWLNYFGLTINYLLIDSIIWRNIVFILHITLFNLSCKGYPSPTESHLWFVGKIFLIFKCNNLNSFFQWSHIFQISKDWICDKIYCWKNNFIIWWAWYWIYVKNGSVEEFRIISFFWRESRLCLWECKGTS